MRSADGATGDPELDIIHLSPDHMVDHPAGAHYALWNGPAFLDVGESVRQPGLYWDKNLGETLALGDTEALGLTEAEGENVDSKDAHGHASMWRM